MSGFAPANQALVVESRLISRKTIAQELSSSGLVRKVLEAESYRDAVSKLGQYSFDLCCLGPSLSEQVVKKFISAGTSMPRLQGCAFIAITSPGMECPDLLVETGTVATITTPLTTRRFSEIVKKAVSDVRARCDRERKGTPLPQNIRPQYTLSHLLQDAANGLKKVAHDITDGRLQLTPDGKPSLATQDAIRLALERPIGPSLPQTDTVGDLFVSFLVTWFVERTTVPEDIATERLRRRLVRHSSSSRTSSILTV